MSSGFGGFGGDVVEDFRFSYIAVYRVALECIIIGALCLLAHSEGVYYYRFYHFDRPCLQLQGVEISLTRSYLIFVPYVQLMIGYPFD